METGSDIDDIGVLFAQECRDEGLFGFSIRSTHDGDVRLIGLELPPALVAKWLRIVADAYEKQVKPRLVN